MAEGILGEIVAHKRAELADRYDGVTLEGLRAAASPTGRSLRSAITNSGARFILEVKKASPSLGAIAEGIDPATVARHYSGVADALSVLTDRRYFAGSHDDLRSARSAFDGPILAKDFFVDLRQVAEARIAGADAILVMLSVLDDAEVLDMIAEARRLGMDALVEVHDEREMGRARALDAELVGINNRDLRDLGIDLATTERLAGRAGDAALISESGISTRGDVDRLSRHVDGFLVGSALMRSGDPADAARSLVFGRTKLCGLRTLGDVASGAAASHSGFVFVPGTPRALTADEAEPLVEMAQARGQKAVGIFRNSPARDVAQTAIRLGLDAVQLHGSETGDEIGALRSALDERVELWVASAVNGRIPTPRGGDRTLFDHGIGGSGQAFDWTVLRGHADLGEAVLAGGIGPDNARAARAVGAFAIDVGSRVDERPGVKSPARIAALFDALRPDDRGSPS